MSEEEIVNVEQEELEQEEPILEPVQAEPVPDDAVAGCPQCDVVNMMAVLGLAKTSCQLVEDPAQRDECIAWSDALDPELIDDLGNVAEGIVEHAGIAGISKYSEVLNETMHTAVIGFVQRKLDAGVPVHDDEMKLYKHLLVRRGV